MLPQCLFSAQSGCHKPGIDVRVMKIGADGKGKGLMREVESSVISRRPSHGQSECSSTGSRQVCVVHSVCVKQ